MCGGAWRAGARVKITRSFMFWRDERREGRPMMDFGGGINIDMDRGRVEPVRRMWRAAPLTQS